MAVLIATLDARGRDSGSLSRAGATLSGFASPPRVKVAHYSAPMDLAGDLERDRPSALLVVAAGWDAAEALGVKRLRIGPTTGLEPESDDPTQLLGVCAVPGCLPERTVVFLVAPGDFAVEADAVELVSRELRRLPLLELSDRLRRIASATRRRLLEQQSVPSPAFSDLVDLLHELAVFEHCADWGKTFVLRDRLREHVRRGDCGAELDQLDHMEWSMLWALIEELDRLQGSEHA